MSDFEGILASRRQRAGLLAQDDPFSIGAQTGSVPTPRQMENRSGPRGLLRAATFIPTGVGDAAEILDVGIEAFQQPGAQLFTMPTVENTGPIGTNILGEVTGGNELRFTPEQVRLGLAAVPGTLAGAGARRADTEKLLDAQDALRGGILSNTDQLFPAQFIPTRVQAKTMNAAPHVGGTAPEVSRAEAIRRETGWFQARDGKWTFEIDDSKATVDLSALQDRPFGSDRPGGILAPQGLPNHETTLGSLMDHELLYDNYPHLRDVRVVIDEDMGKDRFASYIPARGDAPEEIRINAAGLTRPKLDKFGTNAVKRELLSSMLHETQHAVQNFEVKSAGGNLQQVGALLIEANPNPPDEIRAAISLNEIVGDSGSFDDLTDMMPDVLLAHRLPQTEEMTEKIFQLSFADDLDGRLQDSEMAWNKSNWFDAYLDLAGETEARNVSGRNRRNEIGGRMDLTQTERSLLSPQSTEDTPRSRQIVLEELDEEAERVSRELNPSKTFVQPQFQESAVAPSAGLLDAPDTPQKLLAPPVDPLPEDTTEAAVELGLFQTTTAGRIQNQTRDQGGLSVNLLTGENPTTGIMSGAGKPDSPRSLTTAPGLLKRKDITEFVARNEDLLGNETSFLGTEVAPGGENILDVSKRFEPDQVRQATKFAERQRQERIWDLGANSPLPVGRWNDFVGSQEFQDRMTEMARRGSEYLKQFPADEWWDIHGSAFERVYGKDVMPQVAGFSAATSPNEAPWPNVQNASEYLRRWIAGEATVQPFWTVPEGSAFRTPGKKLGMVSSERNLLQAAEGNIDELRRDKVRSMARAMMGDPMAVVLDRHWARLAENPRAGIFTGSAVDQVPAGHPYRVLWESVVQGAENAGRTPRDYSADVWTGIRETIKNERQLFGMDMSRTRVGGDSKAMADVFDDLVTTKAKILDMPKAELEAQLGSGNANLLTVMLASPLAYYAFNSWQQQQPEI